MEALRVEWPDGSDEAWSDRALAALVEVARKGYVTIRQGTGAAP